MFLQNNLSASIDKLTCPWEMNVAKAYTIKEICITEPAKHGTDLVIHLSNILNDCSKSDGETTTVITLEAIICLCYSHTVNIASTWNALRAKFEHEARVRPLIRYVYFFLLEFELTILAILSLVFVSSLVKCHNCTARPSSMKSCYQNQLQNFGILWSTQMTIVLRWPLWTLYDTLILTVSNSPICQKTFVKILLCQQNF